MYRMQLLDDLHVGNHVHSISAMILRFDFESYLNIFITRIMFQFPFNINSINLLGTNRCGLSKGTLSEEI